MFKLVSVLLMFSSIYCFSQENQKPQQTIVLEKENFLELDQWSKKTLYRTESVESTCYEEVEDGYDTVCNDVTYYEESCHDAPSTEVCTSTPSQSVCRTNPFNGEQTCAEVGGGISCHTVGGGRECSSTPYTRNECSDVTRYRTQSYSCMKDVEVPYEIDFYETAKVQILIDDSSDLLKTGQLKGLIKIVSGQKVEMSILENLDGHIVTLNDQKKEVLEVETGFEHSVHIIKLKVIDKKLLPTKNNAAISGLKLDRNDELVSFTIKNLDESQKNQVMLYISRGGKQLVKETKNLINKDSVKLQKLKNGDLFVTISLEKMGYKGTLDWLKKYDGKISIKPSIEGKIISGQWSAPEAKLDFKSQKTSR